MKKFSLLLCCFVALLVSQKLWAAPSIDPTLDGGKTLKITTTEPGSLTDDLFISLTKTNFTKIVLSGEFSADDLSKIGQDQGFSAVTTVDMSAASFYKGVPYSSNYTWFKTAASGSASPGDRAYVGGSLWQVSLEKMWNQIWDTNHDFIEYASETAMNENTKGSIPSYAKYPVYKYCQMHILDADEWVEINNTQGTLVDWLISEGSSHIGEYVPDAVIETRNYYVLINDGGSLKWTTTPVNAATANTQSSTPKHTFNISNQPTAEEGNLIVLEWFEEGDLFYFSHYYKKVAAGTKSWVNDRDDDPGYNYVASFSYNDRNNSENKNYDNGVWVKMPNGYNYYELRVKDNPTREWINVTDNYTQKDNVNIHYNTDEDRLANNPSASDGQYAIVGGSEFIYDGMAWNTGVTRIVDYNIQFNKWSNTLQTAILPNTVSVSSCPIDLFKGCNSLTEVIHKVNNVEKSAKITVSSGEVTVDKAEEGGLFRLLVNSDSKMFNEGTERFSSRTVFKFSNGCTQLNGDDLAALAGSSRTIYESNNLNKFYVDLFDVPTASPSTIQTAISDAIATMREKDWQYKGLLLPEYAAGDDGALGTTLIQDRESDAFSPKATCTEFIGRKKGTTTTMHIYKASDDTSEGTLTFAQRFAKLKTMMDEYIDNTSSTSYLVSTNSTTKLDISSLIDNDDSTPVPTLVQTINNDMVNTVSGKASIYVTSSGAGSFATVVQNSHIMNTPTELLEIEGAVNAADIAAVNGYTDGESVVHTWSDGPRVLDLKPVSSTITKPMLESLTNADIEFILLPKPDENIKNTKSLVCGANYSASMTGLKAVISSDESSDAAPHDLVAYVNVPGSLAEARCLATGNSSENQFNPTPQQLTSVTLAGRLRNTDISTPNANGLANEKGTIQTLDLGDAVFVDGNNVITPTEMNFNGAGFSGNVTGETPEIVLTKVVLPTHEDMDELSKNCFYEMKSLKELCIPFNYKVIHSGALNETDLDHITTTSGYNGVLVDNGPKTYTLSANLEQIGDEPANKGTELNGTYPVFPKNKGVTDLYSLATKVPKCYKDAFGADMTNGYGGQDQSKVYCRERYFNNGDANKAFVVLHIPNEESFDRAKTIDADNAEANYSTMVKRYTDDTKKYSKLDQTGAVDGNGNPLRWPTHLEMLRVYKQASSGLLWSSWSEGTDTDEHGFKVKDGATGSEPQQDVTTSFYDYIGWHQIVLCVSSNVTPTETPNENKEIVREFTQPGWYTFCIPYNLTYSQVLKMMGVPASDTEYDSKTGLKVINKVGTTTVEENKMPDIRQLSKVVRQAGDETHNNKVIFRLTDNLFQGSKTATSTSKETHYLDFADADGYHSSENEVSAGSGDDPICLVGGRPYYIKPYLPDGVTPSKSNLGKYIMTHYADELGLQHSCVDNGPEFCEQLEIFTYDNRNVSGINSSADVNTNNTMRFAKPYENHKVQAVISSASDAGQLTYEVKENGVTKTYRYYYTMVGQFWEQDLPQYCFYMSGQTWYRYPELKGYKWAPYKCIIMATPEEVTKSNVSESDIHDAINTAYNKASIETTTTTTTTATTAATTTNVTSDQKPASTPTSWTGWKDYYSSTWNHFGGGYRNFSGCYFPMNMPGTTNWLLNPFSLCFFGRNDFSFVNDKSVGAYKGSSTRYIFSFGDDEDIVDIDGQTNDATYIETLDGVPQFTTGELKVYSLSGQYMGKTTEGLPRGIYIVGGRKVVVD